MKDRIQGLLTPSISGQWDVTIQEKFDSYVAIFTAGVQHFVIAQADKTPEGKYHCEFMQKQFIHALERLGVRK